MTDPSDAVIVLTWFDVGGDSPPLHDGHLDRVEVKRNDSGTNVVTQWVDYDYASELSLPISADVADSGTRQPCLAQVRNLVLVDLPRIRSRRPSAITTSATRSTGTQRRPRVGTITTRPTRSMRTGPTAY